MYSPLYATKRNVIFIKKIFIRCIFKESEQIASISILKRKTKTLIDQSVLDLDFLCKSTKDLC